MIDGGGGEGDVGIRKGFQMLCKSGQEAGGIAAAGNGDQNMRRLEKE